MGVAHSHSAPTPRTTQLQGVDLSKGIDKGCTANLIVPSLDEIVCRLSLGPLRRRSLVLPISIRPALLAAVSIVVDQGPDTIEVLAGATIGGYRVQFGKIVSQLRAEIRIPRRLTIA